MTAEGTIFDDALRTIQERRSQLLIPVVNDAFGEHHPKDAEVTRLPEAFQKMVSKVVADEPDTFQDLLQLIRKVAAHLFLR